MKPVFLLIDILIPVLSGGVLLLSRPSSVRTLRFTVFGVTLLTSALTWALILSGNVLSIDLIPFTEDFLLRLSFDSAGRLFAGLVSTLWPLTVLYSFEYMENDSRQAVFFSFFTMAYGITLGVAMAGNLFSLYVFYEFLTLSTVPLVMHTQTKEAVSAARTYFGFSLGGAAFALLSMLYLTNGGASSGSAGLTRLFFLFGFFGFGVKSAVFPLYRWLPEASVAPAPVTALLHAVAVVKSGIFAVIRLIYCCYGTELLKNTWGQYLPLVMVIFTIFFGATKAVRETHWKRRLAFSTVANLSYILFGVLLLTEEGLRAGLLHMVFHAEIKILAFFACGAVLHRTGREYIRELDGLGKVMPVTFACFTVSALALTGIPPFSGFVSKWSLLTAGADAGTPLSYAGACVILAAALLTAIYMFTTVRRAWFPGKGVPLPESKGRTEAGPFMLIPMCILAAGILVTGLCAGWITEQLSSAVRNIPFWY